MFFVFHLSCVWASLVAQRSKHLLCLCNFFYISSFIDLNFSFFVLISLTKGLSVTSVFSKDKLLVSLIFSVLFFFSTYFYSDFLIAFLLLTLGFACSSFCSCLGVELGCLRFLFPEVILYWTSPICLVTYCLAFICL